MTKPMCLAACLVATLMPAHAAVLDFGNGPTAPSICTTDNTGTGPLTACISGSFIAQSHGDMAGVLDVRYSAPRFEEPRGLRWWDSAYNNLYGVLWADGGDGDSQAAIDLVPLAGGVVTLVGLDLGAYSNTTRNTTLTVTELGSNTVLFSRTGMVGDVSPGMNLATTFNFAGGLASSSGLRISWQDSAYNVGIDNIRFGVSAVPEPGAWALMAGGLLAVGQLARRRRG